MKHDSYRTIYPARLDHPNSKPSSSGFSIILAGTANGCVWHIRAGRRRRRSADLIDRVLRTKQPFRRAGLSSARGASGSGARIWARGGDSQRLIARLRSRPVPAFVNSENWRSCAPTERSTPRRPALVQAIPSQTDKARLTRSIVSSPNLPITLPIFARGTVIALSTMT